MNPAIALLLSGALFTVSHTAVKLVPNLPTAEIVFFRAIFSVILSFIWLRASGLSAWGKNKPMLVLRGVFGTVALFLYVYTLKTMPLASAFALNYLTPVFTVISSWIILRERPQWQIWIFLAVSFGGVLMVRGFDTRISLDELLAGIGAAAFAAVAYTLVRKLRDEDHPLVVTFYFPLVTLPLTLPFWDKSWVFPNFREWLAVAVIGVFTQAAQYFLTVAFQGAPASHIINLTYVTVVYALVIGYFGFGETFDPMALLGIFVIIASAIMSSFVVKRARSA